MKSLNIMMACFMVASLTACGGGGGGGKSSGSSQNNTLVITAENATEVAHLVTASDIATEGSRTTASDDTSDSQIRSLPSSNQIRNSLETLTGSDTSDCHFGGSSTYTYRATSNSGSSGSLTGQIKLNNCNDDGDYSLNGNLALAGQFSDSGDTGNIDITGSMTLTELTTSKSLTMSGMLIELFYTGDLTEYSESYYASGALIGGSYTVKTTEVIRVYDYNNPTSGTVVVSGADGTSLVIEFDSSGFGVYLTINGGDSEFYAYDEL
ncbi:hypothetical protein [Hahella ganghwensis]|uniref:hypothetical protein n=1 Tax=Hahella ganghwensis TaxID=286420 RepID=UPI0003683078|nr:hypothetical protein [Hahella ganghwensis]